MPKQELVVTCSVLVFSRGFVALQIGRISTLDASLCYPRPQGLHPTVTANLSPSQSQLVVIRSWYSVCMLNTGQKDNGRLQSEARDVKHSCVREGRQTASDSASVTSHQRSRDNPTMDSPNQDIVHDFRNVRNTPTLVCTCRYLQVPAENLL